VQSLDKCRLCGGNNLNLCVDMGEQYLSSIFPINLEYRNKMDTYPLRLALCNNCGLLQLGDIIDLTQMYQNYPYLSSSNKSMRDILHLIAYEAESLVDLQNGDLILDIGGNDGTLLSYFRQTDFDLLNIDAAKNIEQVFSSPSFKYVQDYFTLEVFNGSTHKKAKLVFSIAMFYHLSDPVRFSEDVCDSMHPEGIWVIQMAYLGDMVRKNIYDNIVHEHNGYYSLGTLSKVLEMAGLRVFDVELNNIYGGSFKVYVKKENCKKYEITKRVRLINEFETYLNLSNPKTYDTFCHSINCLKNELLAVLSEIRRSNKTIWAYGASTKGNTILQYCKIDNELIEAVCDVNKQKVGKYMVGSDLEIKDEESMRKSAPDYLLSLPYGFTDDFMKRESELLKKGTKFIRPLPEVQICG
jgi:hypothetical protein